MYNISAEIVIANYFAETESYELPLSKLGELKREIEKEFLEQLAEIERREKQEREEIKRNELIKLEEKAKKEKEKNQPSKEDLRQIRLKFYENKK